MSSSTTKPKPLNVNPFQHSLLCCLISEEDDGKEEFTKFSNSGEIVDRVEQAFRKFDLDQDGFLSWHEFKQVAKLGLTRVNPSPVP